MLAKIKEKVLHRDTLLGVGTFTLLIVTVAAVLYTTPAKASEDPPEVSQIVIIEGEDSPNGDKMGFIEWTSGQVSAASTWTQHQFSVFKLKVSEVLTIAEDLEAEDKLKSLPEEEQPDESLLGSLLAEDVSLPVVTDEVPPVVKTDPTVSGN